LRVETPHGQDDGELSGINSVVEGKECVLKCKAIFASPEYFPDKVGCCRASSCGCSGGRRSHHPRHTLIGWMGARLCSADPPGGEEGRHRALLLHPQLADDARRQDGHGVGPDHHPWRGGAIIS
jgi:hypothetical protein